MREFESLSVSRQCRLLGASRSPLYYRPLGESAATLELIAPYGARWSAPGAAADAADGPAPEAIYRKPVQGARGA